MTNLDRILESRYYFAKKKFCLVKAMVFPVVMYVCKNPMDRGAWSAAVHGVAKNWT